jgi:hypothetical protein
MPAAAPRSNTTKKENQLRQKQQELEHAITSGLSRDKLVKAAERLRAAHLSLLKARQYWVADAKIQHTGGRPSTRDFGALHEIEEATRAWTEKSVDVIIAEHARA